MGIEELQGQAAELERQEENSRRQRQQLLRAMIAQITGCRIEDASASYSTQLEIKQAVEKRKLLHEEQRMEKDELGRRILACRREKEELLDTVWLATSGKQIRQLWTAVAELLQQPPTRLQSEALEIEPDSELSWRELARKVQNVVARSTVKSSATTPVSRSNHGSGLPIRDRHGPKWRELARKVPNVVTHRTAKSTANPINRAPIRSRRRALRRISSRRFITCSASTPIAKNTIR